MENRPLQQRKLAAILFADIAGYTALMQSDERLALANLQKFKKSLEQLVPINKGEIIQFYGDGCLATFHSSLDAVACAKKLQAQYQSAPVVPVRIGVHSGDVVFKEGNVFGDAVNITSRIESMGVPGSVLLSSRVQEHIKNKPGFELAAMGTYSFKNVVDPMDIYALKGDQLVLPKQQDLKGTKAALAKESGTNINIKYPIFAMILLLPIVYFLNDHFFHKDGHLHEIEMVHEDGSKETRYIPKAEFTKKLVSFTLDNQLDDPDLDWLAVGIPLLFNDDLEQDSRLYANSPLSIKNEYDHYQQTYPNTLPFSTELKIAQDFFTDYFVKGSIQKGVNAPYAVSLKVYETTTGKVFQELQEEGDDWYEIVDGLSESFKKKQFLPDAQTNANSIDLPASNLISDNIEAFEKLIKGRIIASSDAQQLMEATTLVKTSTELDPNCSSCFTILARLHRSAGKIEEAKQAIQKANLLAESLPERKRLVVRASQLRIEQNRSALARLLENWRKLYPDDLTPYRQLMFYYPNALEYDKAKEVGKAALERGHRGSILTQLADLYIKTEDYEEAEKLLKEYAQLYPHKASETTQIADIYIAQGKLDKALEFYENLALLGNSHPETAIGLSDIQARLGQFDAAHQTLSSFLPKARTADDSLRIYGNLANHFHKLGKFDNFENIHLKRVALIKKVAPPISSIGAVFNSMDTFLDFGKEEQVDQNLKKAENISEGFRPLVHCIGRVIKGMSLEDPTLIESTLNKTGCKELLIQSNGESVFNLIESELLRYQGDYAKAVEQFETYIEKSGASDKQFDDELLELYRLNKDFEKGETLSKRLLLMDPNDPKLLLATAKLKAAQGEQEAAKELLQKAMTIWSEADDSFKKYQEAKAFALEIGGN